MGHGLGSTATACLNSSREDARVGRISNQRSRTPSLASFVSTRVLRRPAFAKLLSACLFLLLSPALVSADCECGYSVDIGGRRYAFTDLIESDFHRVSNITKDTDWVRQEFNVTDQDARGDYGEMFRPENIASNLNCFDDMMDSSNGTLLGVQMLVNSNVVNGMVSGAEMDTNRLDLSYGTFRASMRLPDIAGTCAAFFWYFNDTQEIDMEFLTKDFNKSNNSYPVNLVLQSRASLATHDAALTGNFIKAYLPFDPTDNYHEYRIDYTPGQVFFYADGGLLGQMNGSAVPTSPGHLILQHWSNGNPLWSGGPPVRDSVLEVEYVKAYFNSTDIDRQRAAVRRCPNVTKPNALCPIPTVDGKNESARLFFFSQYPGMINDQIVYLSTGSSLAWGRVLWFVMAVLFLGSGWVTGVW